MLAGLSLLIWLYLVFAHGGFWRSSPELQPATPRSTPDVDIVIPARDEADSIAPVVASLLAQDYRGRFSVTVVDDQSADGTAELARAAARNVGAFARTAASDVAAPARTADQAASPTFTVLSGRDKPSGWSGKLWALSQGVAAGHAPLLLFADADIVHDPRHLSTLVARLTEKRLDMVSEMVRLNCESVAERLLVPAFIYFFQMLYPFAWVNRPHSAVAAAAGGTVLIRRTALERIGGIDSIRQALIDDVTLAQAIKQGGSIYLGHSGLATSIRRYPHFGDLWQMIARTAFTQLRYSGWMLAGTLVGLTVVWLVPVWALCFGRHWIFWCGSASLALAAASYLPTLHRYRQSFACVLVLPGIALFYMAATLGSAVTHWRGSGARWKQRAYGPDG